MHLLICLMLTPFLLFGPELSYIFQSVFVSFCTFFSWFDNVTCEFHCVCWWTHSDVVAANYYARFGTSILLEAHTIYFISLWCHHFSSLPQECLLFYSFLFYTKWNVIHILTRRFYIWWFSWTTFTDCDGLCVVSKATMCWLSHHVVN